MISDANNHSIASLMTLVRSLKRADQPQTLSAQERAHRVSRLVDRLTRYPQIEIAPHTAPMTRSAEDR